MTAVLKYKDTGLWYAVDSQAPSVRNATPIAEKEAARIIYNSKPILVDDMGSKILFWNE